MCHLSACRPSERDFMASSREIRDDSSRLTDIVLAWAIAMIVMVPLTLWMGEGLMSQKRERLGFIAKLDDMALSGSCDGIPDADDKGACGVLNGYMVARGPGYDIFEPSAKPDGKPILVFRYRPDKEWRVTGYHKAAYRFKNAFGMGF